MSAQSIIKAIDLSIAIGQTIALRNLNFEIVEGQHWTIEGRQAAGKSVLCEALTGKHRIQQGQLLFPFADHKDRAYKRQAIQLVAFTDTSKLFRGPNAVHYYQQRYHAFDASGHMTVRDYLSRFGFEESNPYQWQLLSMFQLVALLDYERIKLSSGQTRKLLLVKALLREPRVLILDDPYIGLDDQSRGLLNALLDRLVVQYPMTLVMVNAAKLGPKCMTHGLYLNNGEVQYAGLLQGIVKQVLSAGKPNLEHKRTAIFSIKKILRHQMDSYPKGAPIITMNQVEVSYDGQQVLGPLSWKVLAGEKWAVQGPNGSGKSTLISLIYGDHPQVFAQQVFLFGQRRGPGLNIWDIKKQIGFTSPELHAFFDQQMTTQELLLSGLFDGFTKYHTVDDEVLLAARLLLNYFGLSGIEQTPTRELSNGTLRLLFFIRAILKMPPLLLLDEPFQGLDDHMISLAKLLIDDLLTESQTLIFISHFESEIPSSIHRKLYLKPQ